ncbi:MAG: hypothetical protein HRS57_02735, partial [Mycoplasmataceae bacterium]|nr:hypothetical protein [Mycoplasmataceae bacterium]
MEPKNPVFKNIIESFERNTNSKKLLNSYTNFEKGDSKYFFSLSNKVLTFERNLYKDVMDLSNLIIEYERRVAGLKIKSVKEYKIDNIVDQIMIIGNSLGYNFRKQIIREVFKQQREPANETEKLMLDIGNAFYSISSNNMDILTLSQKITGYVGFRDFDVKINNAPITDYREIPERYSKINKLIDNENISPILVASFAFFFIREDKFFRANNEMASVLFIEKLISRFIPRTIVELLPIVEIINRYNSYVSKYLDKTSETLDLTNSYVLLIAIINDAVVDKYNFLLENYNKISSKRNMYDSKQKNYYVKILLSKNPNLTKRQASFYIEHRDKDTFYTIEDFKNYTSSSYETSRTSLDNMSNI